MIDTKSLVPQTSSAARSGSTRRAGVCAISWRHALPLAGIAAAAMTVASCSTWSLTGTSSTPAPAATGASEGSFTSRVTSLFTGGSGSLNSASTSNSINCPGVEFRQGAATWAVNGGAGENSAMTLRFQASIIQTARECVANNSNLTVKVGLQGRVVLGPAGSPGTISLPIRYALVRDGLHPKTLWTKLFTVPVSVPPGELNVPWIHVQEDMTVPLPPPQELDAYVIYAGFDAQAQGGGGAKPPSRRKTAQVR